MLSLRGYQLALQDDARARFSAGRRSVLLQAPTGSGKTVLIASMLQSAARKGFRSWFTVHRRELINQAMATFRLAGIPYGVIAAGYWEDRRAPIQIASVQTLARRLANVSPEPRFIVFDECHHCAAATWDRIYRAFPEAFFVGLTATPQRLDGRGLSQYFDALVEGPSVRWLIDEGWLSPFRFLRPPGVSVSGLNTRMGDYARGELARAVGESTVTGDAVGHYLAALKGRRLLLRTVSVEHSKRMAEEFNAAGVPARHVDGDTPSHLRDWAMQDFVSGKVLVLTNVDLFSEGVDVPAAAGVSDLRPTQSLTLAMQFWGRALRPEWAPGMPLSTAEDRRLAIEAGPKTEALILDHAGNCERHGLPDTPREWSLLGRNGTKESVAGVRICPSCYGAQPPGKPACIYCGDVFPPRPREVEYVDGKLVEERAERAREFYDARTFEQLVALGKARGYKRPWFWAKMVHNGRQKRRVG